jgi:predicted DNA-binding transcriptional regulator YafY
VSLAGIPILSKKGFGGGLSLMDGFTLDESFLTSDEKMYVYQGLQILNAANYPETEHVLNKIGALFNQPPTEEWLEIDFSYWGSEETEKVTLSELRKAITEKHLLTFDYFNSELTRSKRNVEPLRLLFKSHAW